MLRALIGVLALPLAFQAVLHLVWLFGWDRLTLEAGWVLRFWLFAANVCGIVGVVGLVW